MNRLLIDLSWNSSRLEGNTYSLLDTTRLIELGEAAEGRDRLEAQMIVNHKEAIEFLVNDAEAIGFNRYTILNLHGILAQNLLPDPGAPGRLRRMGVGIGKSTFHPLELQQLIEECFNEVLEKAAAIEDPFEQALFAMVQLPYLQPFDDVNKRVSRLSANIPFIKLNLSPLSFIDVPRAVYMDAILGVYELNKIDLLRDVFIWAYERSAARYAAVRQSLGEPDPFRFKHKAALRQIVGEVVRGRMDRKTAAAYITAWVEKNGIPEPEREKFRDMAESELVSLHEGNFARYQIRPSEFEAWQQDLGRAQKVMSDRRPQDLIRFYSILNQLEKTIGGARALADCRGRMKWTARGVYFFREAGENRSDTGEGLRVVRVRTHAAESRRKHDTMGPPVGAPGSVGQRWRQSPGLDIPADRRHGIDRPRRA